MKTTTKQPFITRTSLIQRTSYLILSFMLVLGLALMGCEGPQGSQGAQGDQGEQGPVGPAGEDGSVMYADEGAPGDDIGQNGDYYLNQNTGELYGPKDGDGWGEPGIVLKGEDGQDGADGQDGEDGSQIHAGSGAPGGSLGAAGDYYLDQDSYELYGPKTGSGWGSPLNLKGADGNANVTLYIFDGHNFLANPFLTRELGGLTETEMEESSWEVYLVSDAGYFFHIPGFGIGGSSEYGVLHDWLSASSMVEFTCGVLSGPGEEYTEIRIIRTAANNVNDQRSKAASLDYSNYEEIVEYYGLTDEDAVRISSQ